MYLYIRNAYYHNYIYEYICIIGIYAHTCFRPVASEWSVPFLSALPYHLFSSFSFSFTSICETYRHSINPRTCAMVWWWWSLLLLSTSSSTIERHIVCMRSILVISNSYPFSSNNPSVYWFCIRALVFLFLFFWLFLDLCCLFLGLFTAYIYIIIIINTIHIMNDVIYLIYVCIYKEEYIEVSHTHIYII